MFLPTAFTLLDRNDGNEDDNGEDFFRFWHFLLLDVSGTSGDEQVVLVLLLLDDPTYLNCSMQNSADEHER